MPVHECKITDNERVLETVRYVLSIHHNRSSFLINNKYITNSLNNEYINVDLGDRSYAIRIATDFGPLSALPGNGRKTLLISDTNVSPLYGNVCAAALQAAGFTVIPATVAAGEPSKNLHVTEVLYNACAAAVLDRSSSITALGGGVVGDLAGFVAATYLRGLDFIQVPTSLLAMVDSSVGGKTGVNLEAGKNLVGCFYQPTEVVINPETLKTLPEREYRSGLAEVFKYGLILDGDFYRRLSDAGEALRERHDGLLAGVIARCCALKADVVASDEHERGGQRALLNFGHTFGHAIEAWSGYGRMLHGEAVAIGMVFAARLSQRYGGLNGDDVELLEQNLTAVGLPIRLQAEADAWPDIRQRMQSDKKSAGGSLRFVLLDGIGSAAANRRVTESDLTEVWNVISH